MHVIPDLAQYHIEMRVALEDVVSVFYVVRDVERKVWD